MSLKVMQIGFDNSVINMFKHRGYDAFSIPNYTFLPTSKVEADIVVFLGGADIDPKLYGCEQHRLTHPYPKRDDYEMMIYKKCRENNIPMIGICRGAQLLNVLSGGKMVQDLNKHTVYHDLKTHHNTRIVASSAHHQMMVPTSSSIVLATAEEASYKIFVDEKGTHSNFEGEDIEVVYIPETKSLCHQPHPEYMQPSAKYVQYFFNTIDEFILGGI